MATPIIAQFDRATLRRLRPEVEAALAELGDKYGIRVTVGNGSYAGTTAKLTLELATQRDGNFVSVESESFRQLAEFYRLSPDDLGKTFSAKGKVYTIVGLRPKAPTRPIVCANADGNRFVFPVAYVRQALGRAK